MLLVEMCVERDAESWTDVDTSTSGAASAGAVSGLVLLLISVVMTTVLALVWRRYRIKARQRRLSQTSCMYVRPFTVITIIHLHCAHSLRRMIVIDESFRFGCPEIATRKSACSLIASRAVL